MCRLTLRFLAKIGLKQFIKTIYLYSKWGGIKPFFDYHTDSHDPDLMAEFNINGWRITFKRFAEILKIEEFKNVKGIYGVSWFYDPQLANISPRLNYLLDIPISNGAVLFKIGPSSEDGIRDALLKSPTRITFLSLRLVILLWIFL